MKTVLISLATIDRVQKFVAAIASQEGDFELVSEDNYVLDARSLMGIFGFDLSKPVHLRVHYESEENLKAIAPFIVEEG